MTEQAPDGQLVAEFASSGSEEAFGALVRRHAGMVYATALRQVGDAGMAEEVTQNAFLALARKASAMRGHQTLAGWLHRTALLEAKARIRSELRRRRREERAVDGTVPLGQDNDDASAQLVPLLDEALMHLRDPDRQALVLRYLEGCSLRDVGSVLGVEEDAARKRVSRALDRITDFFRQRGFAVPAATLTTLMVEQSATAVPAGLGTATAQAAAASYVPSTFTFSGAKIMALTKTQTAVVTAVLVAIPIAWQWRAQATVDRELTLLNAQRAQSDATLQSLDAQAAEQRTNLHRIQTDHANAQARLAQRQAQLEKREPPPVYAWNDFAPLARVPKALLAGLSIDSVSTRSGKLNDRMIAVLQLNDAEVKQTQEAIHGFLKQHYANQAALTRWVEPTENEINSRAPEEVRVFEVTYDRDSFAVLRSDLFAQLETVLGPERAEMFKRGLDDWMPLDDEYKGLNSSMAIVNADARYVFYRPDPGSDTIAWALQVDGRGSFHTFGVRSDMQEWLPDHLKSQIQDWIDLAAPQPEVLLP